MFPEFPILLMQTPASGAVCCGCDEQIHMDYRSPVEKKGRHGQSLSERGQEGQREPDPCLDRLLLLSGYITSRVVLIYYAQVHYR